MMKSAFCFEKLLDIKSFFFWRYLNFYSDIFGHVGKRPDKKTKLNLEICNVITWITRNYNARIARYLKK